MSRKYKKPPVTEALCEFRFTPTSDWDLVIPGLLWNKIKSDFPKRVETQRIEFGVTGEGVQSTQNLVMRFLNEEETQLVQVGKHMLSVHSLPPYPKWEVFSPIISRILNDYREIAGPEGLSRIGLRYLNKIEVPIDKIELSEYFRFINQIPKELPQNLYSFISGIEIPFSDGRDIERITLSRDIPAKGGDNNTLVFLLDIEYYLHRAKDVALDNAIDWVNNARDLLNEAFEACITDRLREMFEETK